MKGWRSIKRVRKTVQNELWGIPLKMCLRLTPKMIIMVVNSCKRKS